MVQQKSIFHYFILFACCSLLFGCAKNRLPTPTETLATLRQMQDLATVEYTVSKVVKANDDQTWYKFGDRKILITCEADIKAGIDLKDVTAKNITLNDKKIAIVLPTPKILSVNIAPENINVAFEDVGFFRTLFTNADRTALLAQAEQQIRNSGEELGILNQAKINTQLFLTSFLRQLGFEEVVLTFEQPKNFFLNP